MFDNGNIPSATTPAVSFSTEPQFGEPVIESGGQPVSAPAGADEGVPQFVTRAEFEAALADAEQRAMRNAQRLTDKTASRLEKRMGEEMGKLNTSVELLRAQGVQVTDEQLRIARQKVFDTVLSETGSQPVTPSQNPSENGGDGGQPEALPMAAAVQSEMARLNQQYGLSLDPADPEAEGMAEITSPFEFMARYRDGIAAKAERLAVPPQARVTSPVRGSKNSGSTVQSLTAELNGLLQNPKLENLGRIQTLRVELQKLTGS